MSDVLSLPPTSLLIFVDETGNEDLSDPKNPTFGRGGSGVLLSEYKQRISKPWRRLKRERLGGATKPFHAAEFEQSRPTNHQIAGISTFLARPFWRFAAMCDFRTELPAGIDAHKAISLVAMNYFARLVSKSGADVVALIFEASERGDSLVKHDYNLATMDLKNTCGRPVDVEGCFMPKTQWNRAWRLRTSSRTPRAGNGVTRLPASWATRRIFSTRTGTARSRRNSWPSEPLR
jgi:hypothetical protein